MGLFGGKDDNKVGITLSTEPLPQTAQVKQDNSVEDQKYESLKSQWEQIPGILVYTEGTAFSKTRECKFSIQNGEYIITESLDGKYMYQEIPSVLRQIRLGKEYSHKLYNEIPQITKSDDYVGEDVYKRQLYLFVISIKIFFTCFFLGFRNCHIYTFFLNLHIY